jgi:hypothetical protein
MWNERKLLITVVNRRGVNTVTEGAWPNFQLIIASSALRSSLCDPLGEACLVKPLRTMRCIS